MKFFEEGIQLALEFSVVTMIRLGGDVALDFLNVVKCHVDSDSIPVRYGNLKQIAWIKRWKWGGSCSSKNILMTNDNS